MLRGHRHPDRRHRSSPKRSAASWTARTLAGPGPGPPRGRHKDDTTIIEGHGIRRGDPGRIKQIKAQIEETTSDYDREKLQERLAKLSGGVAVIKVGAATEVELKEKKHRVEDALSRHPRRGRRRHRARRRRGADHALAALDECSHRGRRGTGVNILRRALEEPLRQIANNAGAEGSVVVETVRRTATLELGLRRLAGEYGDMVEARRHRPAEGDPLRAGERRQHRQMMLTTETLITDIPEPPGPTPGMPGGMDAMATGQLSLDLQGCRCV